jgi:hypothetical protein
MGDHATFSNEDAFAKGKGKADPTNEVSMDEDSSSDEEPEVVSLHNIRVNRIHTNCPAP